MRALVLQIRDQLSRSRREDAERGVTVDPSTIFRWVQRYAPEIERRIRPYQGPRSGSWRVDVTYVRVGGTWKYLFRAVDKHGWLIASMLSDRRDTGGCHIN